jgi:protein TonB
MKTQETTIPQMDEIIFEKRNKMYGAYILRKMYNKQVNKALLLSVAILIAGLAYPLVSSYRTIVHGRFIGDDGSTTYMPDVTPPAEPHLIPPLPPAKEILKRIVFTTPVVVPGEVIDDVDPFNQEDMFKNSPNIQIDIAEEKPGEKQPEILDDPEAKKETFITAEEMPAYTGGDAERQKFLSETIKYPALAVDNGIQGTVYVQFVVDSKGNITDVKIMRGIGGGCDEEALRVVKMMPPWHPGKQNGKAVRVLFTMPVIFKLQSV